jgi:LPXTG-site transpeptidase (sortase) family protein
MASVRNQHPLTPRPDNDQLSSHSTFAPPTVRIIEEAMQLLHVVDQLDHLAGPAAPGGSPIHELSKQPPAIDLTDGAEFTEGADAAIAVQARHANSLPAPNLHARSVPARRSDAREAPSSRRTSTSNSSSTTPDTTVHEATAATALDASRRFQPTWFTVLGWVRNVAIVVVGFAVYQLYGTGVLQDRQQAALRSEFLQEQRAVRSAIPTSEGLLLDPSSVDGSLVDPATDDGSANDPSASRGITPDPSNPSGEPVTEIPGADNAGANDASNPVQQAAPAATMRKMATSSGAIAIIRIDKVNIDEVVVSGTSNAQLAKGPGWIPSTAPPGMTGNVAIAGHRTTHGGPFGRLNELVAGDVIELSTLELDVRYEVTEVKIVKPGAVSVLTNVGDNRLTLTTCHPRHSDSQRLVVTAKLLGATRSVSTNEGESALPTPTSGGVGESMASTLVGSTKQAAPATRVVSVAMPTAVEPRLVVSDHSSTVVTLVYVALAAVALIAMTHLGARLRRRKTSFFVHLASWIPTGTLAIMLYGALDGLMPSMA